MNVLKNATIIAISLVVFLIRTSSGTWLFSLGSYLIVYANYYFQYPRCNNA